MSAAAGAARAPELDAVEEELRHAGLPHLADGYDPREDTLTRLRPALLVLFLVGLALVLRPDWPLWARALGVAAGLALACAGLAAANLARGRPAFARPSRVGFVEASVFVLTPAVADLILGAGPLHALKVAAGSLAAAALLYALTSLGVVSLFVHLGRAALTGFATTLGLALRALPGVIAVLLFLFLASEVWQAFGLLEGWRFGAVLATFAVLGTLFLVVTLNRERRELCAPALDERGAALARGTAADPLVARGVSPRCPPLDRMERLNVLVALVVSLGARIVLVGAVIVGFFMLFGMLVVDRALTRSWIGEEPHVLLDLSREVVVTEQLVRVSLLLGGFAALYFAVVALTEPARRAEFLDDEIERLARVMAAWTYYQGALEGPPAPPSPPPPLPPSLDTDEEPPDRVEEVDEARAGGRGPAGDGGA